MMIKIVVYVYLNIEKRNTGKNDVYFRGLF